MLCALDKKVPITVKCFRLLSALMNVQPILHAIFEALRSGFIQTLQYSLVS